MGFYNGIRNIDHPVVAVADLEQARMTYEQLGFTVPPRGSHIEWGTGNLCIMFPEDYLEMRGIIDPSRFTMHLDSHLEEHGEGLMGVAFGTADVRSSLAKARSRGIRTGELRHLTRNFEHPGGWTQPSFDLFAPDASDIEGLMHVVIIEHLTPELIRQPEFLIHANSCIGVNSLSGSIADRDRCAQKMRRLLGDAAVQVNDGQVKLLLASGQRIKLDVARDCEPGLACIELRVEHLPQTTTLLETNGIGFSKPSADRVRVASRDACGVTLDFTENGPA